LSVYFGLLKSFNPLLFVLILIVTFLFIERIIITSPCSFPQARTIVMGGGGGGGGGVWVGWLVGWFFNKLDYYNKIGAVKKLNNF